MNAMSEQLTALEAAEQSVPLSTSASESSGGSRMQQILASTYDRLCSMSRRIDDVLQQRWPWLNWALVFVAGLLYAIVVRCITMPSLIETFGAKDDDRFSVKFAGIALGFFEDFIWLSYLLLLLWIVDSFCAMCLKSFHVNGLRDCFSGELAATTRASLILRRFVRFLVYVVLFAAFAAPIAADSVLMRTRSMRFTFEFVEMYFNDKSAASSLEVSNHDLAVAYGMVEATAAVAVLFALVAAVYIDLTRWSPLHLFARWMPSPKAQAASCKDLGESPMYMYMMEQGGDVVDASSADEPIHPSRQHSTSRKTVRKESAAVPQSDWGAQSSQHEVGGASFSARLATAVVVLFVLLVLPEIGLAIAHASSAVVAHVALNTSLNEPFRIWFTSEFLPGLSGGAHDAISSSNLYIHTETESYAAFGENVLYRRTTGFKGDLAFDLDIDQTNLPNVLVIAVESFRYHDSQYLVSDEHKYLLKDQNITVTPNFDRWAKRGIAFRNFWSSWRTSRSVESILYGQLPYDSLTDSGTTGGRKGVNLAGMPQLFKAKGYESVFTTGCRTDYDQWNKFLPSHGFDTVFEMNDFKTMAEADLGISRKDWAQVTDGGKGRAMSYWGVHDDVSFDVLGNILVNKTTAQKQRMTKNEAKKPFFINHYTISSHTPFRDRPSWFADYSKMPDFSKLYADEPYADVVKNYVEMRYFTDLALGKFLDRMEKEGVLNDTIIFITGDHGQAPEFGVSTPEVRQISATRVAAAMIAEGRLSKYAGMMFDDAAEQYDLLNTLADIVGVPNEGFIQSGVGRSLKRKIPFGQRVVWSNNPSQKLAAVRGHERLQFDKLTSDIALFDADTDHDQKHDLFPALSWAQKQEARRLRDTGRWLNMYFKHRWDHKCILSVDC